MDATKTPRQALAMNRRNALRMPAAALLAATLGPALLAACGGGGDAAPAGGSTATPQSLMIGPIGGLGSIIVNGVRFEDNSARVEDDDGASHDRSALKLGMMVEVQSSAIDDNTARATAAVIRFGSEMVGRVDAIDTTNKTLTLLDQTVEVKPETVFEDAASGGFAGIAVGQILEIHALFDATSGHYIATRIEREDSATVFRLRGRLSALNTTAKTFQIGSMMQVGKAHGMVCLNDTLMDLVTKKLVAPEEAYAKSVDKAGMEALLKRVGFDPKAKSQAA